MAIDTIVTQFLTRGEDGLRSTLQGLSSDFSTLEGKQARLNLASNALITGGAGVAGVLGLIGAKSLGAAGQIEGVQAGLTGMLGSADAAKAKIKELQQFAATTPFDFAQTAEASQQLLAMGFTGEELIPTLNSVGNAVASAGGGTEQFKGVLLALGQIKTKGKLSAEELMQMAERGIPVFEILQKKLGLTKEQVSEIGSSGLDAEKGIAALLDGMKEVGGGNALEEMGNTLPGKLSNMGDSVNQLSASVGALFSKDAKDFLGGVTERLDSIRDWVEKNPDLAKKIFAAVGIGAGVAIAVGGAGKLAGIYNEVTSAIDKTTGAKKLLEAATKSDDKAEKDKTGTAKGEGDAIGVVGEKVEETKEKLEELAKGKIDELIKDPKAALTSWKSQIAAFARSPLQIGGRGITQLGGGAVSKGLAAGSLALGAAAGYGAYDDYASMGDDNAEMKGAATGIAVAAAAMFIPGAAIPIAIATGFRYAFNELVNRPMEDLAENGPRDNDGNIINTDDMGGTPEEQYAKQMERARKLAEVGGDDNLAESAMAQMAAKGIRSRAKLLEKEATERELKERGEAGTKKMREDERIQRLQNATDFYNSTQGVQDQRNGARTVTLRMPESSGDEMARQLAFNTNTAAPVYG